MTTPDLYTLPHKSLRTAMAAAADQLASADPSTWTSHLDVVTGVLDELAAHAGHEDEFIHPLLVRHVPPIADGIAAQHADLHLAIDRVRHGIDTAGSADELLALYRAFNRLVAQNLHHLDHEETVAMPTLVATVSERDLGEVLDAFHAAHPEAAALYARWPEALTGEERRLVGVG